MPSLRPIGFISVATTLVAVLGTPALRAQGAAQGGPWQAWIGCWQPVLQATSESPKVCVVPSSTPSAVDVVTVDSGKIVARYAVDPSDRSSAVDREGCTGWERSQWSSDSLRVFVRSELACGPGKLKRTMSGIMSISPNGEWVDAQTVTVGGSEVVRTLRYRLAESAAGLPGEIAGAAAASRRLDRRAASMAAGARLTPANIVEASRAVDSSTVQAWLVERNERLTVDAKGLTDLANSGVTGTVIDVMVALAYPDRYHFDRSTADDDDPRTTRLEGGSSGPGYARIGATCDPFGYYSPFGWGSSACYGYGRQLSRYGYGGYGSGAYGYGYPGYGYGSGFYGRYTRPIVVVSGPEPEHGKAIKGDGYTRGSGSSSRGATATRSGTTRAAPSAGASRSSGGGGRTAKARPPK